MGPGPEDGSKKFTSTNVLLPSNVRFLFQKLLARKLRTVLLVEGWRLTAPSHELQSEAARQKLTLFGLSGDTWRDSQISPKWEVSNCLGWPCTLFVLSGDLGWDPQISPKWKAFKN